MLNPAHRAPLEQAVAELAPRCLELANYLSDHPEVSGQEEGSCAHIVAFLREQGYEVTTPVADVAHSFLARKQKKGDPPRVALLCEYDALPELGHACGHSVSCAVSILAALALDRVFPELPFQVDLVGTPMEEIGGGKILQADAGVFDGYRFAAMAHLYGENAPYFNALASCDMQVTFHGQSAHASSEPWAGRNALNGVQLFIHALDMLRQHLAPGCQMHGVISDGGTMPSIVPDKAVCYFYPRATSLKELQRLWQRMETCAKGAAMATETTCDVEQLSLTYADLYAGPVRRAFLEEVFCDLELPHATSELSLGSTDAGDLDVHIPVFHPGVGIGQDASIKLHSPEFAALVRSDAAADTLRTGASMLASLCVALADNPATLDRIWEEHRAHRS